MGGLCGKSAKSQDAKTKNAPTEVEDPKSKIKMGDVVTTMKGFEGKVISKSATEITIKTEEDGESTFKIEEIMLLDIVIRGAKGLRATGKSDPYCMCEIVKQNEQYGTMKIQTKKVKKALDVTWDHEEGMVGYKKGDDLKFSVFDEDSFKRGDPLGSVVLKSVDFHDNGYEGDLTLTGNGAVSGATLTVKVARPMSEEKFVETVIEGKGQETTCCC